MKKKLREEENIDKVLEARGSNYGKFTGHAKIAQSLKAVMYQTDNWNKLADDQKECLDMICHKIARVLNGNINYSDNFLDISGYSMLVFKRLEGKEV